MHTYSYGLTPIELIKNSLPDNYNIIINSKDEINLIIELTDQGIDSHLETILLQGRDSSYFNPSKGLELNLSKQGMLCLLRRLYESYYMHDVFNEVAYNLRTDILSTLEIYES